MTLKKILITFIVTVCFMSAQVTGVFAQNIPTNATEYCRGQGSPSDQGFQDCVSQINQQLQACNELALRGDAPDAVAACRERILSGQATQEREESRIRREEAQNIQISYESDCDSNNLTPENCGIIAYIRLFTDALLTIVGIVVVMTIVIGGIQYSAARDNPQAVAAAKKRISQALIALVIYLFMFAFLQWLVPGGVL